MKHECPPGIGLSHHRVPRVEGGHPLLWLENTAPTVRVTDSRTSTIALRVRCLPEGGIGPRGAQLPHRTKLFTAAMWSAVRVTHPEG